MSEIDIIGLYRSTCSVLVTSIHVKVMARRKKKQENRTHLKFLVLAMLFFSYIVQPYMPETERTFAHSYYSDLFSEFYDSLTYGAVYAQSPIQPLNDLTGSVQETADQLTNLNECVESKPYLYLSWNANGNPSNTNYIVYRSGNGQGNSQIANQTNTSYNDTNYDQGLAPSTQYSYTIVSENEEGVHNGNLVKSAWTLPNIPALFQMTQYAAGTATFSWNGCGNTPGTIYRVVARGYYPQGSTSPIVTDHAQTTSLTYGASLANVLDPNYHYTIRIRALNGAFEESGPTNLISLWSPVANPLAPVVDKVVQPVAVGTSTGVNTLAWSANNNPEHTDYVICRKETGASGYACLQESGPVTSLAAVPCPVPNGLSVSQHVDQSLITPCKKFSGTSAVDNGVPSGSVQYNVIAVNKGCLITTTPAITDAVGPEINNCFVSSTGAVGTTASASAWVLDFPSDWSTGIITKGFNIQKSVLDLKSEARTNASNSEFGDTNGVLEFKKDLNGDCIKLPSESSCTSTSTYMWTMQNSRSWKGINVQKYEPAGTQVKLWWSSASSATNPIFTNRCQNNTNVCAPAGTVLKLEVELTSNNAKLTPSLGLVRVDY